MLHRGAAGIAAERLDAAHAGAVRIAGRASSPARCRGEKVHRRTAAADFRPGDRLDRRGIGALRSQAVLAAELGISRQAPNKLTAPATPWSGRLRYGVRTGGAIWRAVGGPKRGPATTLRTLSHCSLSSIAICAVA
ncbi:hypothetical protein IFM12275_40100 [Nocardia sputorum]|nr:hypothetical protein IFM12275_40100 [Nocardia sputorum]